MELPNFLPSCIRSGGGGGGGGGAAVVALCMASSMRMTCRLHLLTPSLKAMLSCLLCAHSTTEQLRGCNE